MSDPKDLQAPEVDGELIVPEVEETAEPEVPPVSKRTEVAQGLETLFVPSSDEPEPVPGAATSLYPPGPTELPEVTELAEQLEAMAGAQSSALGKSRGLLVASHLHHHAKDAERAFQCALSAAETSPKLALAALNLAKKAARTSDDVALRQEAPVRALEAAARHATQKSSRAHAIRKLVENLGAEGRMSEVGQVLDQAARSGDADNALLVQRLVHRLGQGASLAGIELAEPLKGAVQAAADVLSGVAKPSRDRDASARELQVVFAARHLAANRPEEVASWLKGLGLPEFAVQELLAALLAAEPSLRAQALPVLGELIKRDAPSRVLRQLAALALEGRNRPTLQSVLERADPASGTFSLKERWFLSACAAQPLEIGRDDAAALTEENPALTLALTPTELSAPIPEAAETQQLVAQVGAGLARLRSPEAAAPLTDLAQEALSELVDRGEEPELAAALHLLVAQQSGNQQLLGESLLSLSDSPERVSGALIGAALLHQSGETRLAERGYRSALSGQEAMASSAIRGLIDLDVDDREDLLHKWAAQTEDPKLSFAQGLLTVLQSEEEPRAADLLHLARPLLRGDLASSLDATDPDKNLRATLVFALSFLAARQGDGDAADEGQVDILEAHAPLSDLVQLRGAWDGERASAFELTRASDPRASDPRASAPMASDPGARALALWRDEPFPLERPAAEDSNATGQLAPASEILLRLAHGITTGEMDEAAHWGSLCAEVDRAAGAIGVDTQKISGNTRALSPLWHDRARATDDRDKKRFAYERLAELDEQAGEQASALLWQKALAEEFPEYVPALLRLEETLLAQGTSTATATERLSQALPESDGQTYRLLFGARALAQSDLREARKQLEPFLELERPPLIALRGLITVAHDRRDDALLLRVYEKLTEVPGTDLDRSTRALVRALVSSRMGNESEARKWAAIAIAEKNEAFAAHQLLNFLHQPDDPLARAEQLESYGHASAVDAHRSELFFEAGQAFDEADDRERAAECYELTLRASPGHQVAFQRLCAHRETSGAPESLERLLLARLPLTKVGSEEHLELELKLAGLLSRMDRPEDAKQHLEIVLESHPSHSGALRAHADVSAQLGAHAAAEKSLIALRDRLEPGSERTEVMRSLARLYDEHLEQAEKAMDAYQAVLGESPEDDRTRADLVRIYSKLGLAERATVMQTKRIQSASTPEEKRDGALQLAEIYERVAGDSKRAGATLERTRKAWPLDAAVLEATVGFMDRQGTGGPRGFLLDRAGKDARRKLETGRLDAGLLDTLSRVARLSGRQSQAEATEAARHAFVGSSGEPLPGAGLTALSPQVDEIVAPTGLSAPLRSLLRKTGAAMDAAFSVDLSNMGARLLTAGPTYERMAQIAQALDSEPPQMFVSDNLGAKCLPITTEPARILIGRDLDEMPSQERDYLLLRALKLRWLGAGALARSKDEDRFPMLAALLLLFSPNWRPTNIDARKTAQARALIEQGLARVGYDDDVPMLALEVIGSLGNHGASVGDKPRILANRVALLGIGDPSITISAMARAEGTKLASGGPSRFRWLESHPEAKDLLLFSTTDKCARARSLLGLGEAPGGDAGSSPRASDARPSTSGPRPAPPQRPEPSSSPGNRPAPPRRPKPPPPKRS